MPDLDELRRLLEQYIAYSRKPQDFEGAWPFHHLVNELLSREARVLSALVATASEAERLREELRETKREMQQRELEHGKELLAMRGKLSEARDVVRPFAEAHSKVAGTLLDPWAGPDDYARAAEWLRKAEE